MASRGRVPRFNGPDVGKPAETFDNVRSGGRSKSDANTTTKNPPPLRRSRPSAAGGLAPPHRRSKPLPVSEGGLYGDSHIPTFGAWNVDGDQNFTGIFNAAIQARKGEAAGGAGALEPTARSRSSEGSGRSGDLYKVRRKQSSSWCCFRSRGA